MACISSFVNKGSTSSCSEGSTEWVAYHERVTMQGMTVTLATAQHIFPR